MSNLFRSASTKLKLSTRSKRPRVQASSLEEQCSDHGSSTNISEEYSGNETKSDCGSKGGSTPPLPHWKSSEHIHSDSEVSRTTTSPVLKGKSTFTLELDKKQLTRSTSSAQVTITSESGVESSPVKPVVARQRTRSFRNKRNQNTKSTITNAFGTLKRKTGANRKTILTEEQGFFNNEEESDESGVETKYSASEILSQMAELDNDDENKWRTSVSKDKSRNYDVTFPDSDFIAGVCSKSISGKIMGQIDIEHIFNRLLVPRRAVWLINKSCTLETSVQTRCSEMKDKIRERRETLPTVFKKPPGWTTFCSTN